MGKFCICPLELECHARHTSDEPALVVRFHQNRLPVTGFQNKLDQRIRKIILHP
jgi:hypothetical protein